MWPDETGKKLLIYIYFQKEKHPIIIAATKETNPHQLTSINKIEREPRFQPISNTYKPHIHQNRMSSIWQK